MQINIIIPTYNRKDYLRTILNQLLNQKVQKQNIALEIIVVVDGSTDGTLEMLKKDFPNVHIVYGTGYWWYTKSMNEGFKYVSRFNPDYVLTLNDDIRTENSYLNSLLEAISITPPDSIIGSVTYTENLPHRSVFSGIKEKLWWGKLKLYYPIFKVIDPDTLSGVHKSVTLIGRGILIPYPVLKKLEYFDEHFAQYYSDMDFCLRARKNEYNSFICWDARIYSFIDKTGSGTSFIKTPFAGFLKGFFNKYSRIYIPSQTRFIFRHENKLLFPIIFIINMLAIFKAFLFNRKITNFN